MSDVSDASTASDSDDEFLADGAPPEFEDHGVRLDAAPPADAVRPLPGGGTLLRLLRRLDDAEARAHGCRLVAHGGGVYMYAVGDALSATSLAAGLAGRRAP